MHTRLKHYLTAFAVCIAVGWAVPASHAQTRMLRTIVSPDTSGAFLGIQMVDVTDKNMSQYKLDSVQGVIVQSVVDGSPAESAGIKEDDVILDFAGIKVRSAIQLRRLVGETPVDREVGIVLSRNGEQKNISVRLKEQENRQAENNQNFLEPFFDSTTPQGNFFFRNPDRSERNPMMPAPEGNSMMPAPERPKLGITLQPLSDQLANFMGVPGDKGVLVSSVAKGSASDGKLKAGDVIISAEGKDVQGPEDIAELVRNKDGGSIAFKVIRDKKEISVSVQIEAGGGRGFRL
jgi:serine protease Do